MTDCWLEARSEEVMAPSRNRATFQPDDPGRPQPSDRRVRPLQGILSRAVAGGWGMTAAAYPELQYPTPSRLSFISFEPRTEFGPLCSAIEAQMLGSEYRNNQLLATGQRMQWS